MAGPVSSYTSPLRNVRVEVDPSNPGTIIRRAFLIEAILNLCSIPMLTHPRFVLSITLKNPSAHVNPASILFLRLFAGVVVGGLTSALLTGLPNTRNAIESRKVTYILLGMGEGLLIPVLVLEAMKEGGRDAALTPTAAIATIGMLLPPLVWRVYTLVIKPQWFGRYREVKTD